MSRPDETAAVEERFRIASTRDRERRNSLLPLTHLLETSPGIGLQARSSGREAPVTIRPCPSLGSAPSSRPAEDAAHEGLVLRVDEAEAEQDGGRYQDAKENQAQRRGQVFREWP